MAKKKLDLKVRAPSTKKSEPTDDLKNKWVDGETKLAPDTEKKTSEEQTPSESKDSAPTGAGIIEYADGSYRRRTTVYFPVETATQLRMLAAIKNKKLNDLVNEAVAEYLETKNLPTL